MILHGLKHVGLSQMRYSEPVDIKKVGALPHIQELHASFDIVRLNHFNIDSSVLRAFWDGIFKRTLNQNHYTRWNYTSVASINISTSTSSPAPTLTPCACQYIPAVPAVRMKIHTVHLIPDASLQSTQNNVLRLRFAAPLAC